MYSEKVMEHFKNPRNVGVLEDADGIGEVGNPICGDMMTFYIKVKDNVIEDIRFQTFGCGAAIAVSSMVSEIAKGKTLEEASTITNKMVAEALDGLPKQKLHCSNLGADALQKAIQDYRMKKARIVPRPDVKKCYCPVCDLENPMEAEYCTGCGKELPAEQSP
ncbi:MAG: Fe-S cluster assembly scaffold protein NifU [Deltaproteobacteria bacterium]|nr:Fe-S cluster assembly scaffold protein NifU [Deltaproteobacteria bacterium]